MEENNKKRQLQRAELFLRGLYVCRLLPEALARRHFPIISKRSIMWTVPREGSLKYRENRREFCVH